MSKQSLLSAEVSRNRALLAGGASAQDVLAAMREWRLRKAVRGRRRLTQSLAHWSGSITEAIGDALPLGAPVGKLLGGVQPMVRREERHWTKLQGIEKQFAFQGAIAVVLPWAVAEMAADIDLNGFSVAGFLLQLLGLVFFYLIIRRATRRENDERAWIFEFLVSTWMRVLAGMDLYSALTMALNNSGAGAYKQAWGNWLSALSGGSTALTDFVWPESEAISGEIARILGAAMRSGAPSGEMLADCIAQIDDERQALLEERLGTVPTSLSLCFCLFFTPAVFLILLGALWPTLRVLTI